MDQGGKTRVIGDEFKQSRDVLDIDLDTFYGYHPANHQKTKLIQDQTVAKEVTPRKSTWNSRGIPRKSFS